MKKLLLMSSMFIALFGCAEQPISQNIVDESVSQNTNEPNYEGMEAIKAQLEGDSLLPYFEFDKQGNKLEVDFTDGKLLAKKSNSRTILILDSIQEFDELEKKIALRLQNDSKFKKSIMRPLDYVCRISLLALNEQYESIQLRSGEKLLSDKLMFESCEYIGFVCEGECDESSEEDPYLKQSTNVALKTAETYASNITVEIYPYRMIASSFRGGISWIYSSAGSETYFKKRQRVWRGWNGMVWRWADFDPDRNGVRANCFSECSLEKHVDQYSWGERHPIQCSHDMATDLDTFWDTEDITVRCSLRFFTNSIQGSWGTDPKSADHKPLLPIPEGTPTPGQFEVVTLFGGGVIGSHYVRHGGNYFYAKTSTGFSPEILEAVKADYGISYR
ncbi:MAG: hypothetical protein OCC49_16560 [Fibrobacterales bacterium]